MKRVSGAERPPRGGRGREDMSATLPNDPERLVFLLSGAGKPGTDVSSLAGRPFCRPGQDTLAGWPACEGYWPAERTDAPFLAKGLGHKPRPGCWVVYTRVYASLPPWVYTRVYASLTASLGVYPGVYLPIYASRGVSGCAPPYMPPCLPL